MTNLISSIRNLAIYSLVLLLIGAGSWELVRRNYFTPKIETITVTKTETKFIKTPENADFATLQMWAKSKIQNEITFKGDMLFVHSYDANKSTDTSAKIQIAESSNIKFYVGVGVASAIIGGYAVYRLVK